MGAQADERSERTSGRADGDGHAGRMSGRGRTMDGRADGGGRADDGFPKVKLRI